MFTGLIEKLGKLKIKSSKGEILEIGIHVDDLNDIKIGDSISCNGVCLTVTKIVKNIYYFELMTETITKTLFKSLPLESLINIERALTVDKRLDGHIVQGHIDTIGSIKNIESKGLYHIFTFEYDKSFSHLVVPKGSISVDGISLTIINTSLTNFSVGVIPYTYNNTNFKEKKIGDKIHIEFDIIGKYLYRFFCQKDFRNKQETLFNEVLEKW